MELLSPAGNIEKLRVAYLYGADAAYIGVRTFSLRAKADNFHHDEHEEIRRIKGNRKLYGALNIYFHQDDLADLEASLDYLALYPFDALIVADIGIVPTLRRHFPDVELHLSTQANCVNAEAAKMYRDIGFTRIVPGRETSLREIATMKREAGVEIEAFVHGAMCVAYSGRCLLSKWMADRPANQGQCAHSCRWEYRVLEERQRPGEYYPVVEGGNFTTILSSRDLCMFDHLSDLRDAGVDSLKIEGRMKSSYYVGVTTRSYRHALDSLDGKPGLDLDGYRAELSSVSHREFSTGFYYGSEDMNRPTLSGYDQSFTFLGIVGKPVSEGVFEISVKNTIRTGREIEYLGFDVLSLKDRTFQLVDDRGNTVDQAQHAGEIRLVTAAPIREGYLIREVLD